MDQRVKGRGWQTNDWNRRVGSCRSECDEDGTERKLDVAMPELDVAIPHMLPYSKEVTLSKDADETGCTYRYVEVARVPVRTVRSDHKGEILPEEYKLRRLHICDLKSLKNQVEDFYEYMNGLHLCKLPQSPIPNNCVVCKKFTTKRCSRCKTWYCGTSCQQIHWMVHKHECRSFPQLDGPPEVSPVHVQHKGDPHRNGTREEFHPQVDACNAWDIPTVQGSSSPTKNLCNTNQYIPSPHRSTRHQDSSGTWGDRSGNQDQSIVSACEQVEVLPTGAFTQVKVVMPVSPRDYWVQLQCNQVQIAEMTLDMSACSTYPTFQPQVGSVCAAMYEGSWYRCRVLCVHPELKIFYLDYGNEEVVTPGSLRRLPVSALRMPCQGIRIKLAPGTTKEYNNLAEGCVLVVKPVEHCSDDIVVVHVEGIDYKVASAVHTSSTANGHINRCIFSDLKLRMFGNLQLGMALGNGMFTFALTPHKAQEDYNVILDPMIQGLCGVTYYPKEKDLVAAFSNRDEVWSRAYILSVHPNHYDVIFCDRGYEESVKQVTPLPVKYHDTPHMVVLGHVKQLFGSDVCGIIQKPGDKFKFVVSALSENTAVLDLMVAGKDTPSQIEVHPWDPLSKQNAYLTSAALQDGLCILKFFNEEDARFMNVLPLHDDAIINQDQVSAALSTYCVSAKDLNHIPPLHELFLCRFSVNGKYYRAMRVSVDETGLKVRFIDYGITKMVTLDCMKVAPENLKCYPQCAVQIRVNGVEQMPVTEEAKVFLQNIIHTAEGLTLKKVITSETNAVDLLMPDGNSVGLLVNSLLQLKKGTSVPSPEFTYTKMQRVQLPIGRSVEFMIFAVPSHNIVVGTMSTMMSTIHAPLFRQINEYCNMVPQKSYAPTEKEICLAKFEGYWYRAVCLGAEKEEARLLFIDFGNSAFIKHTAIRQMAQPFTTYPALFLTCILNGIPEDADESLRTRLQELVIADSLRNITALKNLKIGHYMIDIPSVTATLRNEGLLSEY